ncbi:MULTISPECIES: DUF3870 domain-containing protein [Clostridium]|uniref:DUF3870 domain-containing protein n=1 Tax=Clostridium ragsdalei P11 TaxID=1353534 RepID=A0A1A6AKR4_9CLOT|nr:MULTISPECIES: DUF3870 domain-containing protein [Clostridium]OBR90672.1 hypothetical protein CLRAG_33200 [Clostridium ragsdalei P11]QXE20795.1 hypothetical protein B5S50_19130 [Clostridium sp. 001]
MYMENTVYVVGNAKTNEDNAITIKFNSFYIGFVVDLSTDKIIDLNSSSTLRTTDEFIRSLLIGRNLRIFDDKLKEEVIKRYHGSSQKAIIVAYRDGVKKYNEVKKKYF